ncbi:MAG: CRISPR-associated protein Cas4 [Bacteroidota bacterium]
MTPKAAAILSDHTPPVFTVTDLKQFFYCPRIVYFTYVQPVPRRVTAAMERGSDEHLRVEKLEPRRTVRRYGLDRAEKILRVKLFSPVVGLSGQLDMLLIAGEDHYPVEFKHTRQSPAANHRRQLAAYALLVEEKYEVSVGKGFFCVYPENALYPVELGEADKSAVLAAVGEMRQIALAQEWPDATRDRGKCVCCEWRNFCNDIF